MQTVHSMSTHTLTLEQPLNN